MNERAFQKYLATGEYVPTEDAAPTSLEAHDRRFHPNGFDPKKDHCGLRESMGKLDKVDFSLTDAPKNHPYSGLPVNQNPDFTRPQETRKNGFEDLEERHKAHNDPDYLPPNLRNPYVRKDGKIGMTSEQVNKAQEWERQHKDEIDAYRKAQKTFFEDRKREDEAMLKEIKSKKEGDIDKPIKISSEIRKSSLGDREYAVKNILKAAVKNALSKMGKDSIPGLYDEPTPWNGNLNHNEDVYLIAGKSNNSLKAVVHRNDEEVKFQIVKDNGYQKDEPRSIRKAIERYEETFK